MKLQMIFLAMDTLTLLSMPFLYVYEKIRRFGSLHEEDGHIVTPIAVRSNIWSRQ